MTRLYVIAVEFPDDDPRACVDLRRRYWSTESSIRIRRYKGYSRGGKLTHAAARLLWELPGTVTLAEEQP